MDYGVVMFPTEYAIAPDELARELEARGFESVWFPEHTHIPASRRSPWPGGGELPRDYWSSYDPFVALMAAAAATKRLKLGTGGGWNQEEMANHGTEWKSRWRLLRERVLAMKEIWTKREAEFHGEFVNFDKIWSYPKPVQKPHPPILMGGDGATTFNRVIEFSNGWLPLGYRKIDMTQKIRDLRRQAEAAGRDPKSISITVFGANPQPATLEELAKAGVERAVFMLPPAQRDTVLP